MISKRLGEVGLAILVLGISWLPLEAFHRNRRIALGLRVLVVAGLIVIVSCLMARRA